MKINTLCVYAGLCAGVASMAAGQAQNRELQRANIDQQVEPVQIAKVKMVDGRVVFQSEWMPYAGNTSRGYSVRVFDCFGDIDSDGFPDDSGGCGLDNGRWFFGPGYINLFYTNDMTVVDDTVLEAGMGRADFAWYWGVNGSGTSESCVIALFTQDSEPCDDDSFDYSGWLLDFGTLVPGIYLTNADLGSDTWPVPTGGSGSYAVIYAQEVTTSGAFVGATASAPLFWGTGDAGGAIDMVGTQGPSQFDEVTVDLIHSISECFTYSFTDLCPTVLGPMMQFWGERFDPSCYADFNYDGVVNTQDFLAYLGAWAAEDIAADCNEDGDINTQDFLCFLGFWAAGC